MKEIKLSPCDSSKLKRLTIEAARIQLYECAQKEFALVERDSWKTLFAFQSQALADFLKRKVGDIHSVGLYECNCRVGQIKRLILELRLTLENGSIVTVTDWERTFRSYELKENSYHTDTLYSPYSAWDLAPEAPYVYMLLTGRFVDYIDSITLHGQQRHLLSVMWREHQIQSEQKEANGHPVIIESEFVRFSVTPINSHMIKFDLVD